MFWKEQVKISSIILAILGLLIAFTAIHRIVYGHWFSAPKELAAPTIALIIIVLIPFLIIVWQDCRRLESVSRVQKEKSPKKNSQGSKRKVAVLEGFSGNSIEIVAGDLFKMLDEMGLEIIKIEHMSYKGIISRLIHAKSIEEFAEQAYSKIAELGDSDIIIAYSMGTLVARYILEKIGIGNNPTVILVGGPHQGCRWKYIFLFLVPCIREMLPGSEFLEKMGLPKNKSYWYFVAKDDEKVSIISASPVVTDRVDYFSGGHRMFDNPTCLRRIKEIINNSNPS